MELREILSHVDHTLLAQDAAWDDIRTVCDDGIRYRTASVCIPASYVARAAAYAAGRVPICTVIGFPCGYSTTAAKCFEASDAAANGASEIDMVISVGRVKDGDYAFVLEEIRAVRAACAGKLLKVIIETCLLTDDEKIRLGYRANCALDRLVVEHFSVSASVMSSRNPARSISKRPPASRPRARPRMTSSCSSETSRHM